MWVEKQDEDGVLVKVESVEEEGERGDERMKQRLGLLLTCVTLFSAELEATSLPNPHSTASKKLWLLLKEGTIVLRPLRFGQVRDQEERSDELRRLLRGISSLIADTSVRNVASTLAMVSNAKVPVIPPPATRFARRRRRLL